MDSREQSKIEQGRQLLETVKDVLLRYTSCPNCPRQTEQWSTAVDAIIEQLVASRTFKLLYTTPASTAQRILFCIGHQPIQKAIDEYLCTFDRPSCSCGKKNADKADSIRVHGNNYMREEKYLQALAIFTTGLMFAPEGSFEATLLYANRSAAFVHLKQYENAFEDVDRALTPNYRGQKPIIDCLLLRKAQCLIELGRIQEARDLLENEEARAPAPGAPERADWDELKDKANQASQPRVLKPAVNLAQYQDLTLVANKLKNRRIFHPHEKYPWLSSKVDLRYDRGQYCLAAREAIPFAEVVAVEKPLAALALDEVGPRRCHHCHCSLYKSTTLDLPEDAIIAVQGLPTAPERFYAPVPCTGCSNVLFCSEQCRKEADQTYHKFECVHMLALGSVDKSTHLALRMLYSAGPWEELKTRINSLEEGQSSKKGPLDPIVNPNEYSILYQVMPTGHFEELEFKAQLRQTITICLLVKMAEQSIYLLPNSPKDRQLAGCLLQRHLSQLTANQHHLVHTRQFDLNEQQPQNADSFQLASGVASLLGVASCAGNVLLRPFSLTNLMQSSVIVYAASRSIPAETKLVIDLRSYPRDASFRKSNNCHCPWCSAVDQFSTKCTTCQSMMIKSGAGDEHYKCSSTVCNQPMADCLQRVELLGDVQLIFDYFNEQEASFKGQSISLSEAELRQFDATLKAVKQIAHPNSEILLDFQNMLFKKHAELALRALTEKELEMSTDHMATSKTYAQELLIRYKQMLDGGGATFCNSLHFGRFLSEAVDNFEPLFKAVESSSLPGNETVNGEIVELRNLQENLINRSASIDLKSLVYDLAATYHERQPGPSTSGRASKH